MAYVNFGRKNTRAEALISKNKDKIFFPTDDTGIILGGKEYGSGTVKSVSVKMNGATKGTVTSNGTIDLGNVITSHQDISGKVDKHTSDGVISISGGGKYGFAKLGKFTINSWDNNIIAIEVSGRGIPFTILTIIPDNHNSTEHYVSTFISSNSNRFYIHRDSSTQYSLYVFYTEVWGSCVIHRITGNKGGLFVVEVENLTALPDDCTQVTYGGNVFYASRSGHADTASSAPASDVYSWAKASTKPTYTKSEVGLSNVTNDAQVKRSEMGVANGVATLDNTGRVPSSQLPSYVDDVIEKAGIGINDTGETGKIYVDTLTNKTYRWSGSKFVEISQSLALGETSSTAFAGNRGKALENKATAMESYINENDPDYHYYGPVIELFEDQDCTRPVRKDKVYSAFWMKINDDITHTVGDNDNNYLVTVYNKLSDEYGDYSNGVFVTATIGIDFFSDIPGHILPKGVYLIEVGYYEPLDYILDETKFLYKTIYPNRYTEDDITNFLNNFK